MGKGTKRSNAAASTGVGKRSKGDQELTRLAINPNEYLEARPRFIKEAENAGLAFDLPKPEERHLPMIEIHFIAKWIRSKNINFNVKILAEIVAKIYPNYLDCKNRIYTLTSAKHSIKFEDFVTKTSLELYQIIGVYFLKSSRTCNVATPQIAGQQPMSLHTSPSPDLEGLENDLFNDTQPTPQTSKSESQELSDVTPTLPAEDDAGTQQYARLTDLSQSSSQSFTEHTEIIDVNAMLIQEVEFWKTYASNLASSKAKLQTEHDQLQIEHDDVSSEFEDLWTNYKHEQQKRETSEAALEQEKQEKGKLVDEKSQLADANAKLQKELKKQKKEIVQIRQESANLNKKIEKRNQQLQSLRDENTQLKDRLNETTSSMQSNGLTMQYVNPNMTAPYILNPPVSFHPTNILPGTTHTYPINGYSSFGYHQPVHMPQSPAQVVPNHLEPTQHPHASRNFIFFPPITSEQMRQQHTNAPSQITAETNNGSTPTIGTWNAVGQQTPTTETWRIGGRKKTGPKVRTLSE